jgi:hypothetical protein
MTDNTSAGQKPARSSGHRAGGAPAGADQVKVKADSPEAVLALVPHLLGFCPSDSLVVLGLAGRRNLVEVTFRYDLPDPADAVLASDIAEHASFVLTRQRIPAVELIGYGPATLVIPVLATVIDSLTAAGVQVRDALRAEGGRYWSVLCDDPACCPADGRRFDPWSHPIAAAMSAAGRIVQPDRAALARTLQQPPGTAEAVRLATRLAERRIGDLVAQARADGHRDPQLQVVRVGRAVVQRAIRRYRAGGSVASRDELAWLAVLLSDLRVRDDAWARMDPAHEGAHIRLWTDVVKGAPADYVPAPASLLAFTAWQSGNGALASVALDRALAAEPGYSMAMLLSEALEAALPPSAARLPMTPAEVAAAYGNGAGDRSGVARRSRRAGGNGRPARGNGRARAAQPAATGRAGRAGKGADSRAGSTTRGASSRPSW